MYVHNVSPRRKLWNELSSFGGTEKRDAGITSVQLSSQSDCTWQGRATKHEFKVATKHNRHCKTQRGQLFLFSFFLRLLKQQHCVLECARVRFESQPLTMAAATADVSEGTMQQTIGALWSAPAHWRIPHEDVISPVQSPPGTQQSADRNPAWREIKEKSRFRGGTGGIAAVAAARESVRAERAGDRWADAWTKQPNKLQGSEQSLNESIKTKESFYWLVSPGSSTLTCPC